MRIEADREICIGAGMCALTAPGSFTQDDEDGLVTLLDPRPSDQMEAVRHAVRLCPSGAITLVP